MITTLADVPDGYRHMFYPPKVIEFNAEAPSNFDFKKMNEEFNEQLRKRRQEIMVAFYLGQTKVKPDDEQLLGRLKYAYITEGTHHYITYVDNETGKAYRLKDNSYYEGLLCPLEEITDFTFDRWCRGMDL